MDDLDLQILRTMGIVPFGTWPHSPDALKPSYIAPRVGPSVDRVQDRIRAMEQARIITGYDLHPNPHAFGMKEITYHFRVPSAGKKERLEKVWETPGVFGVYDYIGDDVCVQMFFTDAADRDAKLQEIADKAGLDSLPAAYFDRPYPKPARAPTPLEERILRVMRGRARAPPSEIANELAVSVRTLRRRLDAMSEAGLYDVYVWVDFGAVAGRVPVELNVHFPVSERRNVAPRVLNAARPFLLNEWQPPTVELGAMEVLILAESTAQIETIRRSVAEIPGVDRCEALLPSDSRYSGKWLEELVDKAPAAEHRVSV